MPKTLARGIGRRVAATRSPAKTTPQPTLFDVNKVAPKVKAARTRPSRRQSPPSPSRRATRGRQNAQMELPFPASPGRRRMSPRATKFALGAGAGGAIAYSMGRVARPERSSMYGPPTQPGQYY